LSYTFTFTQTTLLEPFSQVHRKEPLNNPSNHYIEASSTATLNLPTYLPRTKTDIKHDYHTSPSDGHRDTPFFSSNVERDVYVVGRSASSEVYRLGKPRSILRGVCVWSDLEIGARLGVLIISFLYASICASSTITTIMMVVDPNLLLFGMNIIPEWKRRHGRSRWFVAGWQCS
jgi:hypothetical protein